jgi:hypothetical protein
MEFVFVFLGDMLETITKFWYRIQTISVCISAHYVSGLQRLKCSKFINSRTVIQIDKSKYS